MKHLQKRSVFQLSREGPDRRQTDYRSLWREQVGGHSWREHYCPWPPLDGARRSGEPFVFHNTIRCCSCCFESSYEHKSYHQLNANITLLNHEPYNHLLHRRMFLLPPSQSSPHRPRHPLHRHKHRPLPPEEG